LAAITRRLRSGTGIKCADSQESPMTRCLRVAALALLGAAPAVAQSKAKAENVPVIPHEVTPFLKLPPGLYLGEVMGVATNSKGSLYVYTRSANPRLFEFDKNGN